MAVEDVSDYIGSSGEQPYDLEWARRDVQDYHKLYGMPAIIKRNYNSDHIAVGLGPHGEEVSRDSTWDESYGQGFYSTTSAIANNRNTTGYSDGWFNFITLSDAAVDIEPGERGAYKSLPVQGEMPWNPLLIDGDLIILIEMRRNGNVIEILGSGDRFVVQNPVAITMRGEAPFYTSNQESESDFYQDKMRFIAQTFQAVRLPRYRGEYDIPLLGAS